MPATARLAERAAAVGLVGAGLLNEPRIRLSDGQVAGLPGVGVYVVAVWLLLIVLLAAVMRTGRLGGGG